MDNIKTDYVTLWIADAFRNEKSDMVNGLMCVGCATRKLFL